MREWAVATLGKLIPAMPVDAAATWVAARSTEALQPLLGDEDRRCRERAQALTQAIARRASSMEKDTGGGEVEGDDDELPPLE